MKGIKKIVAASTLAITLFGFGFDHKPVEARGLVCILFGCKKAVVKDTDPLYGDPPDYDSLYGKEPPKAQDFNPNSSSPYGWYGNLLENTMGRDIREIIELDKRYNKRVPGYGNTDNKTYSRVLRILPVGKLKKTVPLEDGNTAYIFKSSGGFSGSPGTPGSTVITTDGNPTSINPLGTPITQQIPGTPATFGSDSHCTTYIVADQYGKLFHWSFKGSSAGIDLCSSDERRLR
jgi:hypothetical protein